MTGLKHTHTHTHTDTDTDTHKTINNLAEARQSLSEISTSVPFCGLS